MGSFFICRFILEQQVLIKEEGWFEFVKYIAGEDYFYFIFILDTFFLTYFAAYYFGSRPIDIFSFSLACHVFQRGFFFPFLLHIL